MRIVRVDVDQAPAGGDLARLLAECLRVVIQFPRELLDEFREGHRLAYLEVESASLKAVFKRASTEKGFGRGHNQGVVQPVSKRVH
jgi:hypothetical protein